jgi:hypothetical protein
MSPRLPLRLLAALLPVLAGAAAPAGWPEIRPENRPWSRWWWFGSIADSTSLRVELKRYAEAGLGGLELTPIYGVRGEEPRFAPYLSAAWLDRLEATLTEARPLGLGIDLATGTGWPFGGPWLSPADAAHHLAHRRFVVRAGATLDEPVTLSETPVLRFAGPRRVPLGALRQPLTANTDLQDLALDQVRWPGPLALVTLMGFPAQGPAVDLTSRVAADGRLDWRAPVNHGEWTLYALFTGLHGKLVERAAPGGEGYALDHLSANALHHYLARFDAAFAGRDLGGVRAFFNDSYEVDDATGASDFTPAFLDEFQRRRGYDLRQALPELFNATNSRVLSDYRETVSDLLLDEFTRPWRRWAQARGARVRNQAHGAPANLLDLYAASDIPEQEGNDILATKLASSAAHLAGKPLTSAETGTWLDEHFLGTLAQLKAAVDTNFLGGVNHIVYHGTAFSPPAEPWPGFQFYAAVELNPANPLWHDLPILNHYVTRAQSWLQRGGPDEDVLLYYNLHDRWADRGDGALPHFNGGPHDGVGAREVGAQLRAAGLGFDYVSDRLLAGVRVTNGELVAGATRYRALVVPPTRLMPAPTLARLAGFAAAGARLVFLGDLPAAPPGRQHATAAFGADLARLREWASAAADGSVAPAGNPRVQIGPNLPALLVRAGLRGERLQEHGLGWLRRSVDDATLYFLVNRGSQPIDGWLPLQADARDALRFDPMTDAFGRASLRQTAPATTDVYLQLAPGESCVLVLQSDVSDAARWPDRRATGATRPLEGAWSVRFDAGGPTLPAPTKLAGPAPWTDFAGEAGRVFAGTATYSVRFPTPDGPTPDAWLLDLGAVHESARVRLNGREIGAALLPPYRVVIAAGELQRENTLKIVVTNLAANRIADLDRRRVIWKRFYNVNFPPLRRENAGPDGLFTAAHWPIRPSGLQGPVTLTPLRDFTPAP